MDFGRDMQEQTVSIRNSIGLEDNYIHNHNYHMIQEGDYALLHIQYSGKTAYWDFFRLSRSLITNTQPCYIRVLFCFL